MGESIGLGCGVIYHKTNDAKQESAQKIRQVLATYREAADLIRVGAYVEGSSPPVDAAVGLMPAVDEFLCQPVGHYAAWHETRENMDRIAAAWPF